LYVESQAAVLTYFCGLTKTDMPRKFSGYLLEGLPIHSVADKGRSVGRSPEGIVVFVEGAVPGDVADVWIYKKRKDFMEGRLERLRQPSPHRVAPFCRHFSVCGGCKWQHLAYAAQLAHKEQAVVDAFERIAKVPVNTTATN
jgi:23S rRNA (uracil1939-C5)-methyltransferase